MHVWSLGEQLCLGNRAELLYSTNLDRQSPCVAKTKEPEGFPSGRVREHSRHPSASLPAGRPLLRDARCGATLLRAVLGACLAADTGRFPIYAETKDP
jgi:hypothetical protein